MTTLVAVGTSGTLTTSPDGTTWTSRTSGFGTTQIQCVAWSAALNLFVAGGAGGALATSPNGVTWTARTSGFTDTIQGVAWSPGLNLFVAVGSSGKLATSPDGTTWTLRTSGFGYIYGVAWSPALNLFVAVGVDSTVFTTHLATSPDGITWTARTSGFGTYSNIYGVAWSPGLNLFVAVGGDGSSGKLATSPDGTTWTLRTSGFSGGYIYGVAWSPALNLFVAVGSSGVLTTSPDGTTWTARTSGSSGGYIYGVAWSPALNLFVAVGVYGSTSSGFLSTSPDGVTWTAHTSGFGTNPIFGVASGLENVAPNAPTLNSPATGATVDRGITQRLAWTFSDPDIGDHQSAFDLRYRTGTGAWTTVTGTISSFWDAVASTFTAALWEWQVRCYDRLGLVGPWSTSSFVTAADAPGVPTITAPTSGSTLTGASVTVAWSTTPQTDYQIRKVADIAGAADPGTIYYDSGDVVDATTRSTTLAFPTNSRWEHIQIRIKASGMWTSWADCRVFVNYAPPMTPTISTTPNGAAASISVTVTNPTPTGSAPATSYNDIHISSPVDPEVRWATHVAPNGTWVFREPASGRVYTIRAVAVGVTGGTASST